MNEDFQRQREDAQAAAAEAESITFLVDLSVGVDVRLAYHLINLNICQTLTNIVHHLYMCTSLIAQLT